MDTSWLLGGNTDGQFGVSLVDVLHGVLVWNTG